MTITGPVPPALLEDLAHSRAGELLLDALAARWPSDSDELNSIARYALLPPGKFLRPVMTMTAAEAVGGDPSQVLPAALAMEYLHVATLTHDDIIDGDLLRRGRPTVHVAHGFAHAIVTGDHLIFAAFTSLAECRAAGLRDPAVVESVAVLAEAGSDLCRGQMLESRLAGYITAEPALYLEMARLKTGALFRAVCQIGALLGGATSEQAAALGRYGSHLGVAFQIRDDLILFADPEESDKPTSSDLANGRPTLPVLMAYQTSDEETRLTLAAALARRSAEPDEFDEFRSLLMTTSALQDCQDYAAEFGRLALEELSELRPSHSVDLLTGIVQWAAAVPQAPSPPIHTPSTGQPADPPDEPWDTRLRRLRDAQAKARAAADLATDELDRAVAVAHTEGHTQVKIADALGVSQPLVHRLIRRGKSTDLASPLALARRYRAGLIDRDRLLNILAKVDYRISTDTSALGYSDLPDQGAWGEVIQAHRAGYLTDDDYSELAARVFGSVTVGGRT